jgi:hypothetical protein
MSEWWAVPMLLSGGLFVGGLVTIAWERVPASRTSNPADFRTGFARTLRRWAACSRRSWSSASARPSALPAAPAAPPAPSRFWPPAASWSSWPARWPCWSRSSGAWSRRGHRRRAPRRYEPVGGHLARCNLAVWESVQAFKDAFGDPQFQATFAATPTPQWPPSSLPSHVDTAVSVRDRRSRRSRPARRSPGA